MIAATREYIARQIKKCNSDYTEIADPFADNDISLSLLVNKYKLAFGPMAGGAEGNFHTDNVSATIELYSSAGADEIKTFDELYDLGICIKNTILTPADVKNSDAFSDIIFESITPEPLQTNDKVFKILIELQIRRDYDYKGE